MSIIDKCNEIYGKLTNYLVEKRVIISYEYNFNTISIILTDTTNNSQIGVLIMRINNRDNGDEKNISIEWITINDNYRGQKYGTILLLLSMTNAYLSYQNDFFKLDDSSDNPGDVTTTDEQYHQTNIYGKLGFSSKLGKDDYSEPERELHISENINLWLITTNFIIGTDTTGAEQKRGNQAESIIGTVPTEMKDTTGAEQKRGKRSQAESIIGTVPTEMKDTDTKLRRSKRFQAESKDSKGGTKKNISKRKLRKIYKRKRTLKIYKRKRTLKKK
jgi:predicted GNAT family N-acyltransferase